MKSGKRIASEGLVIFTLLAVMIFITSSVVHADNWVAFSGAENLREFVSGGTAEIELKPGVIAIGKYDEDGTAQIKAWNKTFQRTWEVRGDDQVCYSSAKETKCFTFEQNLDVPGEYRATHVETGKSYLFRDSGTDPRVVTRDTAPDDGGSLGAPSAAEIAAELANPNTTLGTMNFFLDYTRFQGDIPDASGAEAIKLSFQPGMPYPLTETANLFFRPLFPVILKQDVPGLGGFEEKTFEFGDITYDLAVFNSAPNGFVYGGGVAGAFPTATDDDLGLDQWLLGPEVLLAVAKPWGVMGVIASHQWDVGGDDDFDTSVTGGQYFYSFNIKNGWVIAAGPTFSYNHKADSGNKWTLPIGAGVAKTKIIGGRPWRFGLQYWYYVESPDNFGPQHQIRFQIAPVVKLPW